MYYTLFMYVLHTILIGKVVQKRINYFYYKEHIIMFYLIICMLEFCLFHKNLYRYILSFSIKTHTCHNVIEWQIS